MTELSKMADALMRGEAASLPMSDTPTTPETLEKAKIVLKLMQAELDELLELRKQERWNEELDNRAQNLSIQVGILNAVIELQEDFGNV